MKESGPRHARPFFICQYVSQIDVHYLYMKRLKFKPHLCEQILIGEKTSTWRLFDDKDLAIGDIIEFINKDTLQSFGTGEIISLKIKTLGTLEESDWDGHERFASEEVLYETYRSYYGPEVGLDTEVKIINFTFKAT